STTTPFLKNSVLSSNIKIKLIKLTASLYSGEFTLTSHNKSPKKSMHCSKSLSPAPPSLHPALPGILQPLCCSSPAEDPRSPPAILGPEGNLLVPARPLNPAGDAQRL
ncbi:unnamed protein product, partial [Owenia fusiformis]